MLPAVAEPPASDFFSTINLRVPPGFNFHRTALSHGWCSLPPFRYGPDRKTLEYTFELLNGTIVHAMINGGKSALSIKLSAAKTLHSVDLREIRELIRSCLRVDVDLSGLYNIANRHPSFRWIQKAGAGRLLRSPSAFEDAVKIICTTNCTWQLTTIMVTKIVRTAGKTADGIHFAFPTPQALASLSEKDFRVRCSTGYRAPYLRELATRVASGELPIERWRDVGIAAGELEEQIRQVKGMGPYAAGNMLRLLGNYESLALDSWVRSQYFQLHSRGRKVSDAAIERRYREFGKWKGLIFWLDMTRSWHEGKFPAT